MRAEHEIGGRGAPLPLARGAIASLVHVLSRGRGPPRRAHVEQVHEEVVGQRLGPAVRYAAEELSALGVAQRAPITGTGYAWIFSSTVTIVNRCS